MRKIHLVKTTKYKASRVFVGRSQITLSSSVQIRWGAEGRSYMSIKKCAGLN